MNLFTLSHILVFILNLAMAIFVFFKTGFKKPNRMWALLCLLIAAWGFCGTIFSSTQSIEIASLWWQIGYVPTALIPVVFFHFVNEYIGIKTKIPIIITYLSSGIFLYFILFQRELFFGELIYLFNEYYSIYWPTQKSPYFLSFYLINFWLIVLLASALLLIHFRKSTGFRRKQMKYLILGTGFGWIGPHGMFASHFGLDIYPYSNYTIGFYTIIIGYAMLRHNLMEINVAIKRSIVYSLAISIITIAFLTLVMIFERLFQTILGYQSTTGSIFAAVIIAILFTPVKNKVQNFIDHTFYKGSNEEIAEQNEKLLSEVSHSEKLKAIATLASGMAHEIKNPLTAIKTFSEHLPKKLEDKKFLIKFGQLVGKEVNRVDELVHQLLEFARPAPLSLVDVDLHKLLNETLELQNNSFIEHHITVIKNFDTTLPLHINADANQLKQAFLNLILNAIEAMPNGGILTVGVRVQGLGDREKPKPNKLKSLHPTPYTLPPKILISITDTGCGIDKEAQKQIFEPFYSNKDHGTGLGLSITYGIIQEHKGNIQLKSLENKGTTFTIQLPKVEQ